MSHILPRFDVLKIPAPEMNRERGERRVMTMRATDDRSRLAALREGDLAATSRFITDISGTVWAGCCVLAGEGSEAWKTFVEIMAALRANNFARLSPYDGRGTLDTFVALTVRELLAERMLRLLQSDREKAWNAFVQLFETDIARLIRRRLPGLAGEESRRDAWQDICVALIESDYRRLKAYGGSGSFAGFVLRTVDRLLIDRMRSAASRRRLPASIARLGPLDQEVFKLVAWQRSPQRTEILQPLLRARLNRTPDLAEIGAALARVRTHAPNAQETIRLAPLGDDDDAALADDRENSPEDRLLEQERQEQLASALAVLERAVASFPAEERLYLTVALGGAESLPSREIARLMRLPVEDVYKLKQRVMKRLRDEVAGDSAVKNWRASV